MFVSADDDSFLSGLFTPKDLTNFSGSTHSSGATLAATTPNLPDQLRIAEEGFWDALTMPKERETSGTSISDQLSSLFFRHLHLDGMGSDHGKSSETTLGNAKDGRNGLVQRVSTYLAEDVQMIYPGAIRTDSKSQALELFRQVEPWSKFSIKDMRTQILGDLRSNEGRKQEEDAEEGLGGVGLVTYRVKARTEDFLYEALCSSTWSYSAASADGAVSTKSGHKDGVDQVKGWVMRSHQQTPIK